MKREFKTWQCRDKSISLGEKTLVMGILNTTPDSFSDGGKYDDLQLAYLRATLMIEQGADIIDVGGESTRPGADSVSEKEEIRRTKDVIAKIKNNFPNQLISIDTTKSRVAKEAINAGASIINDVSALQNDPDMGKIAAQFEAGVVLMHKQGSPKNMQINPNYKNVIKDVHDYLNQRLSAATNFGIKKNACVIDPGIGFGKTFSHNLQLLKHLSIFGEIAPILIGVSRKKFIGEIYDKPNPTDRLQGSLAASAYALSQGAHILRVHDVLETCELTRMFDTINGSYDTLNGTI